MGNKVNFKVEDKDKGKASEAKKKRAYTYQSASYCINFGDFQVSKASLVNFWKNRDFAGGDVENDGAKEVSGFMDNGAREKDKA